MEQMKCSACGGSIMIDEHRAILYCPFCGTKMPQKQDALDKIIRHKEYTRQFEEEVRQRKVAEKRADEKEKDRSSKRLLVGLVCALVVIFGFMFYMAYAPKNKLENQVKKVQQLIAEGNYNLALIEAQSIRKDKDGLFDSEPAFWEQQRKDLIKLIEQKKKESE